MTMLTTQRLRELLHYDQGSGVFTWKVNLRGHVRAGDVAGSRNSAGYIMIGIQGRNFFAHRLAWLYVHGEWPKHHIDHMNGDKSDNRLANLREATRSTNLQNQRRARVDSTCGLLGVEKGKKNWHARIKVNGRRVGLGTFQTPEEAHAAYLTAKRQLHAGCTI